MTRMMNNALDEFIHVLNTGSTIIQGDHMITALQSNYRLDLPRDNNGNTLYDKGLVSCPYASELPDPAAPFNSYCVCQKSMDCLYRLMINDGESYYGLVDTHFTIPNFYVGCYPVRALLYSSLTCFFEADCLDVVASAFSSFDLLPSSVTVINASYLIISTRNTTVGTLAAQMFVEKWDLTVNYSGYYNACSPLYCTYNYANHHSLLDICSAVLSLIGGLSAVLKALVPLVVRFIVKRLSSENTTFQPIIAERPAVRKSMGRVHHHHLEFFEKLIDLCQFHSRFSYAKVLITTSGSCRCFRRLFVLGENF